MLPASYNALKHIHSYPYPQICHMGMQFDILKSSKVLKLLFVPLFEHSNACIAYFDEVISFSPTRFFYNFFN